MFDKCPICESELVANHKGSDSVICPNGCYETECFHGFTNYVFRHPNGGTAPVSIFDNDSQKDYKQQIINQMIEYWREDDKYLAEILERWSK